MSAMKRTDNHITFTNPPQQNSPESFLLGYKTFMTISAVTDYTTHKHTPDPAPQVDGTVSRICDAAPLLLACSSVCDKTEAPQNPPPPPACYF